MHGVEQKVEWVAAQRQRVTEQGTRRKHGNRGLRCRSVPLGARARRGHGRGPKVAQMAAVAKGDDGLNKPCRTRPHSRSKAQPTSRFRNRPLPPTPWPTGVWTMV